MGKIRFSETSKQAAIREFQEETTLVAKIVRVFSLSNV